MKNMKKLFALLVAVVMVFAMTTVASAADSKVVDSGNGGLASIKVNLPAITEATAPDVANNTYKIYKVFDATVSADGNISYKLMSDKSTVPTVGFALDGGNNVTKTVDSITDEVIAAIAAYVTGDTPVATVDTTKDDTSFTVTGLDYGYYYITTTTGSLVILDSTTPSMTVTDKNKVPEVNKKITGASSFDDDGKKALAEVGTKVSYEATIAVKSGAENYVFHDKMDAGLKYNNDVEVYVDGVEVATSNYTAIHEGTDTLTIKFDNDYVATLADKNIVIKYSATVTSAALTTDPANNTAYVSYGDENSQNHTPTTGTKVYNAKFTVTKHDGNDQPLAGAGFVIKNSEGKYYKFTAATETDNAKVEWVSNIEAATEHTSDANGAVPAFVGLANGTYTLVEKTVPAGYNKAADSTFTVAEHYYDPTNLEQSKTVVNNSGSELPSTGGIGTTIFYVVGGLLVVGAAIVLISKKRMSKEA